MAVFCVPRPEKRKFYSLGFLTHTNAQSQRCRCVGPHIFLPHGGVDLDLEWISAEVPGGMGKLKSGHGDAVCQVLHTLMGEAEPKREWDTYWGPTDWRSELFPTGQPEASPSQGGRRATRTGWCWSIPLRTGVACEKVQTVGPETREDGSDCKRTWQDGPPKKCICTSTNHFLFKRMLVILPDNYRATSM